MTVNFSQAVSAYARAAERLAQAGAEPQAEQTAGESFAALLSRTVDDAVATGQRGEALSMQAVANQADLNEIVTAVTNAEVTLQTVVAIRDRVIQAYHDIIRMPI